MTKLAMLVGLVGLVGCGASKPRAVSPDQQTQAMKMYCEGSSLDEIATSMSLARSSARDAIRDALVDLNRRFSRERHDGSSSRR